MVPLDGQLAVSSLVLYALESRTDRNPGGYTYLKLVFVSDFVRSTDTILSLPFRSDMVNRQTRRTWSNS